MKKPILLSIFSILALADVKELEEISVTATKFEKSVVDLSESITVLDSQTIEDKNIMNISTALNGVAGVIAESKNGGYDARLIIRGAGLKANYGVREIMVVRDGVPMTDPDSFTRFDYIDMEDVESIEIHKGPASLYATNTVGGVIHIKSKSVFDNSANRIKLSYGSFNEYLLNARYATKIDESNYLAVSANQKGIENSWREHNEFSSTQLSLKYGHFFENDGQLESELSYTQANMQIPTSMTESEFETFQSTGTQEDTSSAWQQSARNSNIVYFNTSYKNTYGDLTIKPRVYATYWNHFHPVTGIINKSDLNGTGGFDFETKLLHETFGNKSTLISGVTAKADITENSKKYKYADYTTAVIYGKTKITEVTSDELGDLASNEDSTSFLYGIYAQDSISLGDAWKLDIGFRLDNLKFNIDGYEYYQYDYSAGNYATGDGAYAYGANYLLFAPKAGLLYKLNDKNSIYTSIAKGDQAPTTSEIGANNQYGEGDIDKASSYNAELGFKGKNSSFDYEVVAFENFTTNEIVSYTNSDSATVYKNAGMTRKQGIEAAVAYKIDKTFTLGTNYTYSDFRYLDYVDGGTDYSGNYMEFIPKHKYSIYATLRLPMGLKTTLESNTYGEYYMDSANTDTYEGYTIYNLMIGYEMGNHNFVLNGTNLLDTRYAVEASKSTYSSSYSAGSPRSIKATYSYKF